MGGLNYESMANEILRDLAMLEDIKEATSECILI